MQQAPVGVGLGFRFPHATEVLQSLPEIPWFEVIADDLLFSAPRTRIASQLRENYALAFHAIGLNIAGGDELDVNYIKQLATLVDQFDAAWLSDHLCWSASEKRQHFDLLPFPFTENQLDHISARVHKVQELTGYPLTLENISFYTRFDDDEMSEWEFHAQLCERTGCSLLLDLNNLWSNALNFDKDPLDELRDLLRCMPSGSIKQLHLAGSSQQESELPYWIDAHAEAVPDPVIELLLYLNKHYGEVPSIIERDNSLPTFSVIKEERDYLANCIESPKEYEY